MSYGSYHITKASEPSPLKDDRKPPPPGWQRLRAVSEELVRTTRRNVIFVLGGAQRSRSAQSWMLLHMPIETEPDVSM